ncbi:MAG TPA: hypothetical protein V6C88_15930 [Chroococcidiopsis sp.]
MKRHTLKVAFKGQGACDRDEDREISEGDRPLSIASFNLLD